MLAAVDYIDTGEENSYLNREREKGEGKEREKGREGAREREREKGRTEKIRNYYSCIFLQMHFEKK